MTTADPHKLEDHGFLDPIEEPARQNGVLLAAIIGFVTAALVLAQSFGLALTANQQTGILGFVSAGAALYFTMKRIRDRVTPGRYVSAGVDDNESQAGKDTTDPSQLQWPDLNQFPEVDLPDVPPPA